MDTIQKNISTKVRPVGLINIITYLFLLLTTAEE